MKELEISSIINKQGTKLITIREAKLECIREIEQEIKQPCTPPKDKLY
jgi:hypothetical protein